MGDVVSGTTIFAMKQSTEEREEKEEEKERWRRRRKIRRGRKKTGQLYC